MIELEEQYFYKFDEMMDKVTSGPKWLSNDAVAQIVANAILNLDQTLYDLICFTIMLNHVHLVIELNVERTPARSHESHIVNTRCRTRFNLLWSG
jgi:putative transposase